MQVEVTFGCGSVVVVVVVEAVEVVVVAVVEVVVAAGDARPKEAFRAETRRPISIVLFALPTNK